MPQSALGFVVGSWASESRPNLPGASCSPRAGNSSVRGWCVGHLREETTACLFNESKSTPGGSNGRAHVSEASSSLDAGAVPEGVPAVCPFGRGAAGGPSMTNLGVAVLELRLPESAAAQWDNGPSGCADGDPGCPTAPPMEVGRC